LKDHIFISDLHLLPGESKAHTLFMRFLDEVASGTENLYILGDFLEVWWGDDDPAEGYQPLFNRLQDQAEISNVFFMHGNRDFMIGQDLAERCNFTIIEDPHLIRLGDMSVLLMHGDTLCTDDVDYQKFRQMVRNPLWKQEIMKKTLQERYQLAQSIRENSKLSTSNKAEDIMDVNQQEVERVFKEYQADAIIHGHTHRPAVHSYTIDGRERKRYVLGDWHDKTQYMRVNGDTKSFELVDFS
jgi:UDP-2,3-diacylglucosamine hydrolase